MNKEFREHKVFNKHKKVLEYLQEQGTITSWEAIEKFGATRLSAIIFNLRKKGYDISTINTDFIDRYGNEGRYAIYKLNDLYKK